MMAGGADAFLLPAFLLDLDGLADFVLVPAPAVLISEVPGMALISKLKTTRTRIMMTILREMAKRRSKRRIQSLNWLIMLKQRVRLLL